jgi:hypothetical protein
MPGQPFSLANLREVADTLYPRRGWQLQLAKDLHTTPTMIRRWFNGERLPDLRRRLADLCRLRGVDDPNMLKLAHKLEQLGPPE